jgi:hypothetical protein
MVKFRSLLLITVLVLAVAGCGWGNGPDPFLPDPTSSSTTSTVPAVALPVFPAVVNGPPMTMEALLDGTLSIDLDRQCIVVASEHVGWPRAVVIWPPGTTVDTSDAALPALVMPDGTRYQDSDPISLGGGSFEWDALTTTVGYEHLSAEDVCGAESVFLASGVHYPP